MEPPVEGTLLVLIDRAAVGVAGVAGVVVVGRGAVGGGFRATGDAAL
jgi:hypothetical protein